MSTADSNAIVRAHLVTVGALTALIGGAVPRIYILRLPENCELPALSFFTRGGISNPHQAPIPAPSVQFDCWGNNPIEARSIYDALHDALQGLTGQDVVIAGSTYRIASAVEEVVGQDLVDTEIQNYFRTLTFYRIDIISEPI